MIEQNKSVSKRLNEASQTSQASQASQARKKAKHTDKVGIRSFYYDSSHDGYDRILLEYYKSVGIYFPFKIKNKQINKKIKLHS